ncbi:MAG: SpoIID/LytB domain-containing protein [Microcoleaceae cyanobacterium]
MTRNAHPINPIVNTLHWLKQYWWISLVSWLLLVAPAQAALILRIAIEENVGQVKVGSSTAAVIRDSSGRTLGNLPAKGGGIAKFKNGKVVLQNAQASQLWIEPTGGGYVWIGEQWYRGKALLLPRNNKLTALNYVGMEPYLYSVLGAEMNGSWPQEALKAQAVAARSYALYKRERSNGIYDLGDDQNWQVYRGVGSESSGTQAAVNATAGQVLTHGQRVILAVFHAASGGHTENSEDVWENPYPYLRGVPDYDQEAPVYSWTKTFSQGELSKRISGVGQITAMTPAKTSAYGGVISMKVVGTGGNKVVSGSEIARALGLRSTRFKVQRKGSGQFVITGRGFGHGVGMSQWGAYSLAQKGANYQQILQHYYRGTTLAKIQLQ